jgi:hypothetical protein
MSKSKKAKPKIKVIADVPIAPPKPRKKTVSSTAYSKEHPSPHAFKPGISGNPLGRYPGVGEHLFSRNAPKVLGARAEDDLCTALGLPKHSSVSMCILRRCALDAARNSDPTTRANARDFLLRVTEGTKLNVNAGIDFSGEGKGFMELIFIDGVDGRPSPEFMANNPNWQLPAFKALPAPEQGESD